MKDFLASLETLQDAAAIVYQTIAPTPQYAWPLLQDAVGAAEWDITLTLPTGPAAGSIEGAPKTLN